MSASTFDELASHEGHEIECVTYGLPDEPANAAIECLDCGCVLLDYDNPNTTEPA
jgi:hypothetical protein